MLEDQLGVFGSLLVAGDILVVAAVGVFLWECRSLGEGLMS